MALPGDHPLELYRGDFYGEQHTFTDTDTGDPVDLSGRTWRAEIRASQEATAALVATMDVDATAAATGVIAVTLPADQAALLTGPAYFWDLEATLVSDTDVVKTWLAGEVEVTGDVSRA